ncbi:MAG: hypothetical protein HOE58_09220 [Porticoccaceae bacterium]|nr:hypothetical protein [Porticoccaceae bacterium]
MRVSYLKERHKVHWFQRFPPKKLQHLLGTKLISINLKTEDRAVAVRKVDLILAEWEAMLTDKGDSGVYRKHLEYYESGNLDLTEPEPLINPDIWSELTEAKARSRQDAEVVLKGFSADDQASFWALQKAKQGTVPPPQFQYSIRQGLASLIAEKKGTIDDLSLDKFTMVVDRFVGVGDDRPLEGISRPDVVLWVKSLDKATGTKSTYLSCLKQIFEIAQDDGRINAQLANPFSNIKLGKSDKVRYKFMPDTMLREIVGKFALNKNPDDKLIANLLRSTGMRQAEIFNCTIETHDGIACFAIDETEAWGGGKTDSAKRLVPIPERLQAATVKKQSTWRNSSAFSKRFGKAKAKVVTDRAIACHSLRATFITWAGRKGYTEQQVAWLVGHEEGKGDAMTGKNYFKGYTVTLMQEIIEGVNQFKE